jgi:hypothetical protein
VNGHNNLNSGFESSNESNTINLICSKLNNSNTAQLKFIFVSNGKLEDKDLIDRLVGKSKTSAFQIPIFKNTSDIILYCILNGIIIGYIRGKNKKISEFSNNKNNNLNSNNVSALGNYIIKVEISPECRGKKLCNRMLSAYIKFINDNFNNVNQFNLINTGGIASCRCYIKTFKTYNFKGYDMFGTELSSDLKCTDKDSLDFMFFRKQ